MIHLVPAGGPDGTGRLCAAIVDRLTFNAFIIETGTDFYRLAHIRVQQGATPA